MSPNESTVGFASCYMGKLMCPTAPLAVEDGISHLHICCLDAYYATLGFSDEIRFNPPRASPSAVHIPGTTSSHMIHAETAAAKAAPTFIAGIRSPLSHDGEIRSSECSAVQDELE